MKISYMLKKIISMLPENKLLNFILISLSFAIILLIIYLHNYIVEPLTKFQEGLENVNYRSNTSTGALKRNDEIGDLYKKFHIMLKKLEASYQQQVEMISSISHDLKTPLTSIIGYVERLSREKGDSGLGLAICKSIVEAHFGEIKMQNRDNYPA